MAITPVSTNENDNWFGYGERKGSCNESYDFIEGNMTGTRIFLGPWSMRGSFIRYKLLAEVLPGQNGNNQSVTPPNSYPDVPSATAYKCEVEGIFVNGQNNNDVGQIVYDLAKITVHYKLFPFGWPDGGEVDVQRAFIEESVESTSEIIPIPYNFEIIDDSPGYALAGFKKVKGIREGKLNKVITIEHYKLTVPIVIEPDFETFNLYAGHTNYNTIILPSNYAVAPDRFRYDGYGGISKRELSQGRLAWTITLNFAHYYPGWNTLPAAALTDPDDPDSDVVLIDADIIPPLYTPVELNHLIYGLNWVPEE